MRCGVRIDLLKTDDQDLHPKTHKSAEKFEKPQRWLEVPADEKDVLQKLQKNPPNGSNWNFLPMKFITSGTVKLIKYGIYPKDYMGRLENVESEMRKTAATETDARTPTSQNVIFTGGEQTNESSKTAIGRIEEEKGDYEAQRRALMPGTTYTIAWKAIYCRSRKTGQKMRYLKDRKEEDYYLDESLITMAKMTTAAEVGTIRAAREKAWKPALGAAAFLTVAVMTLIGIFAPEAFTVPWDDGFSKIYSVGTADMFSGMKTMTHWNNEYVFEDSINVVGHTAVQTAETIHLWGKTEVYEKGYDLGAWGVEAAEFTYYWYTDPVVSAWTWYGDLGVAVCIVVFICVVPVLLVFTILYLIFPILGTIFLLVILIIVLLMWLFGVLVYLALVIAFLSICIAIPFMWAFGIIVYAAIAIVGAVLLLIAAIGGIITAVFYVLFFALCAIGCVAVAYPLFIGLFYGVGKVDWLQEPLNRVSQAFRAKTLRNVQDALTTEYAAKERQKAKKEANYVAKTLKLEEKDLLSQIKLHKFFCYLFIVASSADILTDAVYAGVIPTPFQQEFINPAMHIAVVLFLLLPILVLFVQHQAKMGEAWLQLKGGSDRTFVRLVLDSDWRIPLMPMFMLLAVVTFWVVLSYRFAVKLGRYMMHVERKWLTYLYGAPCGDAFAGCTQKVHLQRESDPDGAGFSSDFYEKYEYVGDSHIMLWNRMLFKWSLRKPVRNVKELASKVVAASPAWCCCAGAGKEPEEEKSTLAKNL